MAAQVEWVLDTDPCPEDPALDRGIDRLSEQELHRITNFLFF